MFISGVDAVDPACFIRKRTVNYMVNTDDENAKIVKEKAMHERAVDRKCRIEREVWGRADADVRQTYS